MENKQNDKCCDICKVNFNSRNDEMLHYKGKKHIQKSRIYKEISCGIFVTGFSNRITKKDLEQYFSQFGEIKSAHIGPKLNYMLLVFENQPDVVTVLNKTHVIDGQKLIVQKRNPSTKLEMAASKAPLDTNSIKVLQILQGIPDVRSQLKVFIQTVTPNLNQIVPLYHRVNKDVLNAMHFEFRYCEVYPFGSTTTSLQFNDSDIDIFVNIRDRPKDDVDCLKEAKKALHRSRLFRNIIGIPSAKVPIIKCVHIETEVKCDINFSNMLGVRNSQLIRYYLSMDNRLRPVMLAIKYWAKAQGLVGLSQQFSNYGMVMMFIFFLQQNYLFPSVFSLQQYTSPDDPQFIWNANFSETRSNIHLDKLSTASHLTILEGFFSFYSDFSYSTHVISPYSGKTIDKRLFMQLSSIPQEFDLYRRNIDNIGLLKCEGPICVQDPFIHNFNACGSVSQKMLEKFIILCKFAVENILSAKKQVNMLYLLFTQRPEKKLSQISPPDPQNYLVCIKMKNYPHYLRNKLTLSENNPNHKKELLKLWFENVYDYVYTLFKKVYKFEVEDIGNSDTNNAKTLRRENQNDVYDFADCKRFRVKCFINLWDSRNLDTSSIKEDLEKCETSLERSIVVSEYLWKSNSNILPSTSLFECVVNIICLEEPAMVNIELIKISSYKKVYKAFCKHLLYKLPNEFNVNETELSLKL